MGQAASEACGMLSGRRDHSLQAGPMDMLMAAAQAARTGMPMATAQAAPMGMPMATAEAAPTGMPMATAQAAPMGMPLATAQAAPMGMAAAQAAPMGMATAQAAPVGMPMATAQAAPMGMAAAQAAPMGMATAQAAPVGMPMATAQATPVTEQQARMELPGKRKSLLVGINYYGTQAELSGCVADVKRMRPLLEQHGFPSSEDCQMVLLDEPGWPKPPTKANLQRAIRWLTQDVQTGDALFFHYSGHGGREESYTAASGYVETICPEDYEVEGMLLDTELFDTLVRPLPAGCRLTCLMDCCHSGGVLNLPYLFTGTQENLKQALAGKAVSMAMSKDWIRDLRAMQSGDPVAFLQDAASMGLGLWGLWKQRKAAENADSSGFATDEEENVGLAVGEVVAITGCRSDQTSADVGDVQAQFRVQNGRGSLQTAGRIGKAGGALTAVFLESLKDAESFTYLTLLERIRARLEEEDFDQVPQLATSLLIELNQPFSLATVSLPSQPSASAPGARSAGGDGSGMASAVGSSALLAGFMASMAAAPHGQQMLSSARRSSDGGMPYAKLLGGVAGFDGNQLFGALQGLKAASSWREAANAHLRRMSSGGEDEVPHSDGGMPYAKQLGGVAGFGGDQLFGALQGLTEESSWREARRVKSGRARGLTEDEDEDENEHEDEDEDENEEDEDDDENEHEDEDEDENEEEDEEEEEASFERR
ncbi:unnamed protein product [Effrenium voratum]|nr:unnamed protein product [Effrenium voratum]